MQTSRTTYDQAGQTSYQLLSTETWLHGRERPTAVSGAELPTTPLFSPYLNLRGKHEAGHASVPVWRAAEALTWLCRRRGPAGPAAAAGAPHEDSRAGPGSQGLSHRPSQEHGRDAGPGRSWLGRLGRAAGSWRSALLWGCWGRDWWPQLLERGPGLWSVAGQTQRRPLRLISALRALTAGYPVRVMWPNFIKAIGSPYQLIWINSELELLGCSRHSWELCEKEPHFSQASEAAGGNNDSYWPWQWSAALTSGSYLLSSTLRPFS